VSVGAASDGLVRARAESRRERHYQNRTACSPSLARDTTMASVLLRRRLAHNISFAQRRLLSSTSSVLAQEAQGPSSSATTPGGGGKNAYSRHIAEDLGGLSASEVLAETGTRKDAQMRHFTGESCFLSFSPVFFALSS
jgi:hypothetical protein